MSKGSSADHTRYQAFHGRKSQRQVRIPFNPPEALVFLGRAVAIEYESDKLNGTPEGGEGDLATYRHEFHKDDILCTDKTGRQLYILGPKLRTTTRGIID